MKRPYGQFVLAILGALAFPGASMAQDDGSPQPVNLMIVNQNSAVQIMSDGANPEPMQATRAAMLARSAYFSKLALHFDPERLEQPGKAITGRGSAPRSTVDFAGALFGDEWVQDLRAARDAFAKRELEERYYQRIKNLDTTSRTSIQLYWPVQIYPSRYDFDAESFPVAGTGSVRIEKLPVGRGSVGVNCIQFDRTFELSSVDVPSSDAEDFIFRNQSSRVKGSAAAIFVGIRATILGNHDEAKGDPRGCALKARVDAIEGFEYIGNEARQYNEGASRPGDMFKTWFVRDDGPALQDGGEVDTPFFAEETPAASSAEAKEFKLLTEKGLVLIGGGQLADQATRLPDRLATDNLKTYADFLFMGSNPKLYEASPLGQCIGNKYLSEGQRTTYLENGSWKGSNEFETKRSQQAFIDDALPTILQRAVASPKRFIIVDEFHMPQYDFQNNGFQLHDFNRSGQSGGIRGECSPYIINLGSGDYIESFWSIPPAEAEAVLDSVPTDPNYGSQAVRPVYAVIEVEIGMLPFVYRIPGSLESGQVPVISRIKAATLYADAELSRVLHKPKIYNTRYSILEAGLPEAAIITKTHAMEFDHQENYLYTLKARGNLSDQEWSHLAAQQMMRDTAYVTAATNQAGQFRNENRPGAPLSLDEAYTPFFPWRYMMTGYAAMPDSQKELFRQWSKMQAEALP